MTIETKYNFGEIVCLITDPLRAERIVTNITINPGNSVRYCLMQASTESWHYEFEITTVKQNNVAGFNK